MGLGPPWRLCVLIALLTASSVAASAQPPLDLDLTKVVELALAQNPALQAEAERRAEVAGGVEEVAADLMNLRAAVFYRFNNNVAAGLGYTRFDSEVDIADPDDSGRWKFANSGGELFLRVSF